jgi:hypothetical protein
LQYSIYPVVATAGFIQGLNKYYCKRVEMIKHYLDRSFRFRLKRKR